MLQEVCEKDIAMLTEATSIKSVFTFQNILCFDDRELLFGMLTLSKLPILSEYIPVSLQDANSGECKI